MTELPSVNWRPDPFEFIEAVTLPPNAFILEIKLPTVSDEVTVTVPEFPDRSVIVKEPGVIPEPAVKVESAVELVSCGFKSFPKTSDPGSVKSALVFSPTAIWNLSVLPK